MTFPTFGRLSALGLVLGLAACGDKDTTDGDTDADTDTDVDTNTCTSAIKPVLPTANAVDVYYRTQFVVEFTADEDATATFALVKASDGSSVALGTPNWSTNGKQAAFSSAAPLEPSTQYKLQVTYSCSEANGGPSEIPFTTSSTGAAVGDDSFLGNTYAIDLSTATIIEPAGVNSLLGSLLGQLDQTIAVVPTEIVEGELFFYGGLAESNGTQDQCEPTIVFPEGATFEDPYFSINAPDGIDLTVSGVTISLLSLNLSGSFTADAAAIEGLTLAGQIDTRDLVSILGDTLGGATGDDAVCNLVGTFTNNAVQCSACPGGEGDYCLSLVAANIVADGVDWDLQEISESDVAENPACEEVAAAK